MTYEELPAVFDPERGPPPGAPLLHGDKGADARIADAARNVVAELHGGVGDVADGLAAAHGRRRRGGAASGTTQRVQHAHLETHGSIGWLDEDGRLVLRTSTQVPFLVRDELCHVFDLARDDVRVFTAGSAAASAASRRCSPRTSSRSPCCAPAGRCATSSAAPTSSRSRRAGTRSGSTSPPPRTPTAC